MSRFLELTSTKPSVEEAADETEQVLGFTDSKTVEIAKRVDGHTATEAEKIALDALRDLFDGAEGY